ncbi:MAG TPA: DUF5658 family protein [Steroidobacteraceae bacterium]|nr:DUF5658 family protein [Steroidobacteraceae bacterium]
MFRPRLSSKESNERRRGPDRRRSTLRALVHGSFHPRRHGPRRGDEASFAAVDWHHPQWLGISILIVVLSCVDAFLTITLIDHGAYEANPFMAPLVASSPLAFALVKIGLTGGGVVVLTLLARMRAFRRIPISALLYALLIAYAVLVTYEARLLRNVLPL